MKVLTEADFAAAAETLDCPVQAIKAVTLVEAPKGGFNPDGSVATLFEAHQFSKRTGGVYDYTHSHLSSKKWDRSLYGKTWEAEKDRLNQAILLDREQALKSASWGKFQIMGFNHRLAGFDNVEDFVSAMHISEREHLMAFVAFIEHAGLGKYLRRQDWTNFALAYNGPRMKGDPNTDKDDYDLKIARAYVNLGGPTSHLG